MTTHDRIEVRRADVRDLDGLLPLVAAYRRFYGRPPDATAERAFVRGHLEHGTSVVLVAVVPGGEIAGFAQIFPASSTVYLAPALILEDLFVRADARRRGYARALLAAACEHARCVGAAGMFLETAMDNTAAQHVYEDAGWTREGRFVKYNATL